MDLLTLACFVAVAEELHFRRAAARVHLTQPALSARIKSLESQVGARLVERDRRHVALTPAGLIFVSRARSLIADANAAAAAARAADRGESGRLRIGRSLIALTDQVNGAIAAMRDENPTLLIESIYLPTPTQEQALLDGHLDVGIVHPPLSRPGLQTRHLHHERLMLVVSRAHKLGAEPGKEVATDALDGQPIIMIPRWLGPSLFDNIFAFIEASGIQPRIAPAVAPFAAVVDEVSSGEGVGIVTQTVAWQTTSDVVFRPLVDTAPRLPVAAAWRPGGDTALVANFFDHVMEMMA